MKGYEEVEGNQGREMKRGDNWTKEGGEDEINGGKAEKGKDYKGGGKWETREGIYRKGEENERKR